MNEDVKPKSEVVISDKTISKSGTGAAVTLKASELKAAGLKLGDRVRLRSSDGQIAITAADSDRDKLRDAADWSLARYDATFKELAK